MKIIFKIKSKFFLKIILSSILVNTLFTKSDYYNLSFNTPIKEKEGLSYEQTANRFDIGKTTLVRLRKRFEPARSRNKAATKINMEVLRNDIKAYPDVYNYERAYTFSCEYTWDLEGY